MKINLDMDMVYDLFSISKRVSHWTLQSFLFSNSLDRSAHHMEVHYPGTLEELLNTLEDLLPKEVIEELANMKRHMLVDMDHELNQFICDHLVNGNKNRDELYRDCHRNNPLLVNIDRSGSANISQLALMKLWDRLQKESSD